MVVPHPARDSVKTILYSQPVCSVFYAAHTPQPESVCSYSPAS